MTLGPKGRNVILGTSFGAPTITKDGVSVAREIELKDPLENLGAQMVKEVASKTSDMAGDGTTTATLLAQAIFAKASATSPPGRARAVSSAASTPPSRPSSSDTLWSDAWILANRTAQPNLRARTVIFERVS